MELFNLKNVITVFGAFLVFDEDIKPNLEKQYADCTISIHPEPNNPTNKAGKLMRIINSKEQIVIILRPSRIDIEFPRINKNLINKLLEKAQVILSDLSWILEHPLGNRIAFRSDFCIFDDELNAMRALSKNLNVVTNSNETTEMSIRLNTPEVIQGEPVNIVTNINNAIIGVKKDQEETKRKSLLITYDVNTVVSNTENRFEFETLLPYYEEMINNVFERSEHFN
ncbi:MAG: hypothetical protein IKT40_10825 [Bacilli bacterium]|nr:hypothetical protein [Bacilli bacterium]